MTEMSPLRRRMIKDVTVRNLSPRPSDPTFTRSPNLAASSAVRQSGLALRMSAPSKYTSSLQDVPLTHILADGAPGLVQSFPHST